VFNVHVQPRASRDEITGIHGDRIKIRITAPPVDGKANEHLMRFLAIEFKVSKRQVILVSGETGRDKRFKIEAPMVIPLWFSDAMGQGFIVATK
jgi:uncharacterized protein (TIGR00251 family)